MSETPARRKVSQDAGDQRTEATLLRLQSAALAATADAVVITDSEGMIVWVNPSFTDLTGYTLEEARGRNPRDLVKSGKQEGIVYERMWETILSGRTWHGHLVNRRKDGSDYQEEQTITPVRGADGEISHFIAIKQNVTKRMEAEEALRMSEERFRLLFERATDCVFSIDANGIFTTLNNAFETITGWPPAEWLGKPFQAIVHAEDQPRAAELFKDVIGGKRGPGTELRVRTSRGDYRDIELKGFPNELGDGRYEMQSIGRDITERKRAERAMAGSLSLLEATLESTADGILVVNGRAEVVQFNQKFAEIWRIPKEILESRDDSRMLAFVLDQLKDAEAFMARVRGLYAQPESMSFEVVEFKDGRILERFSQPQKVGGQCVGRVWSFRDVTARKRAERQLREQNEILYNSHDGILIVGLDDKISLWSGGAARIFGVPEDEALGRRPEDVLGIEDPGVTSRLRMAVERDGFWSGDLRARTRDGRKIVISSRVTLVRDEAGRPRARLNFLVDITEKKELEEKLFHMQRLESIGMLAAGIAHDLNNMLAPIIIAAPLLRPSLKTQQDLRILDTLARSAERGARLVKQILGFAQSTTGEFRPTQLKHVARDIIGVIEETFSKSIQLEHNISADLWSVMGDATQIHQVLLNLCVNARDAMPQGGTLRVEARNLRLGAEEAGAIPGGIPGAWVLLEVTDTGTGIPAEVLDRIWTPFFTTKGVRKGTGLGLSTVRGIVISHHGFVELNTRVGQGTTFRVYLPAADSEPTRASSASPFEIPEGHGELILVVDDEGPVRETVSRILERRGYRVMSCADGKEGIELFAAHSGEISLVVTDFDMPKVGGAELTRALLQRRPGTRILHMSGIPRSEAKGTDISASEETEPAFLPKPFTAEELLRAVDRLIHPPEEP